MTYVENGIVMYTYHDIAKPEIAGELHRLGLAQAWEVDKYIAETHGPNAAIDGDCWKHIAREREMAARLRAGLPGGQP